MSNNKKGPTQKDLLKEILSTLQAREADYGFIIKSLETIAGNTQRIGELEDTIRGFMDYVKQQPTTAKPQTPPQERAAASTRKTEWRPSSNPQIEWCPEQLATPADVADAKDPNIKAMWYLEPRGNYDHGSIFRHKNGKAPRRRY